MDRDVPSAASAATLLYEASSKVAPIRSHQHLVRILH
jgi:hypothetical protein